MILYSALYDNFHPFDVFLDGAEKVVLGPDELPYRSDGWLIIWGGGDIHPSQYGRPIAGAHVGPRPTQRDLAEERMMREAVRIGLPVLGVCRGAQLACAVAGGVLIQHVNGHGGEHPVQVLDADNARVVSSSLHHQMMYPYDVPHEMLAISSPSRSTEYSGLEEREELVMGYEPEPEVVWFPEVKSLAIQGHPEFMRASTAFNQHVFRWMTQYGYQ